MFDLLIRYTLNKGYNTNFALFENLKNNIILIIFSVIILSR